MMGLKGELVRLKIENGNLKKQIYKLKNPNKAKKVKKEDKKQNKKE